MAQVRSRVTRPSAAADEGAGPALPTPMTSGPALPPASGIDGQGQGGSHFSLLTRALTFSFETL